MSAAMTDKLEPCPFCGGQNISRCIGDQPERVCDDCGCSGPLGDTEAAAALLWNTRAQSERASMAEEIERLREALDMCRAIIKFHVKPERCVSMGDKVVSARMAFESAVAALNSTTGGDNG